jgi:hypothetical protein
MNSSFVVVVMMALMVAFVAAAPSPDQTENSEFAQLTVEQRTCIANAVRADTSIIGDLKNCHTNNGGLACVKAIPALASCFA